jgi:hypothetical protein
MMKNRGRLMINIGLLAIIVIIVGYQLIWFIIGWEKSPISLKYEEIESIIIYDNHQVITGEESNLLTGSDARKFLENMQAIRFKETELGEAMAGGIEFFVEINYKDGMKTTIMITSDEKSFIIRCDGVSKKYLVTEYSSEVIEKFVKK